VDVVTCPTGRRRQVVVGSFGLVMLLVAGLLLPGAGGWVALTIGAICAVSGITAIIPNQAYVRFSPDGLTVTYVLMPPRTVAWRDIAAVTSEGVRQIRHTVPSMVVTYAPGYEGKRLGQRLRNGRSAVGNFTAASGDELAADGREFLARYGGQ
jgi:hypothetical protein